MKERGPHEKARCLKDVCAGIQVHQGMRPCPRQPQCAHRLQRCRQVQLPAGLFPSAAHGDRQTAGVYRPMRRARCPFVVGSRKTRQLAMDITFADGRTYSCTLEPTQDNRFLYTEERVQDSEENTIFRENGHFESRLAAHSERHESLQVFAAMRNWHPVPQ